MIILLLEYLLSETLAMCQFPFFKIKLIKESHLRLQKGIFKRKIGREKESWIKEKEKKEEEDRLRECLSRRVAFSQGEGCNGQAEVVASVNRKA